MKRLNIIVTDEQYELLKRHSFEKHISINAIVRQVLDSMTVVDIVVDKVVEGKGFAIDEKHFETEEEIPA